MNKRIDLDANAKVSARVELIEGSVAPEASPRAQVNRRGFLKSGISAAAGLAGYALLGPMAGLPADAGARTVKGSAQFKGVTVRVGVGSFMTKGVTLFTRAWEEQTGGRVELVSIPFGDLYSKLVSAFASHVNAYDIIIYADDWIPEFAKDGYVISLEKYYPQKHNWTTVVAPVQHLMYVKGKRYTVPLDGDCIFGYYRTDAVGNPAYAAKFRAKYGYDLAAPRTWKQYHDIAQFFTGWDWAGSGHKGWGVLEAMGPHDVGPYIYVAHATAYSAHPDLPGTLFFDPATMEPQVANPGWVRALKEWKDEKAFGPPQMTTYGGGDERGNYPAGDYVFTIDWADTGVQAQDPSASKIRGKLGYFILPGSNEVYNYKTKTWDKFSEPSHAPYLGWGGWHGSVTSTSHVQDAAWDFLSFLDSNRNALIAVTTPGTARNPYRDDQFEPQPWVDGPIHYDDPKPYLDTIHASFFNKNTQYDLRIPGSGQYFNALDKWVQLALSGSMSAEDALNRCARDWDGITNQFGRKSQQEFYASLYKS